MGVEHVVLLCLENRSFDHLLGFLEHPDPTFEGPRRGGPHTNPGADGVAVAATPDAKRVLPFGPAWLRHKIPRPRTPVVPARS